MDGEHNWTNGRGGGLSMRVFQFGIVILLALAISTRADLSPSGAPAPSNSAIIIAAATTSVKATAGTLRRVTVTTEVASATIKLFDLASASCTGTPSTNPKAVLTLPATISNPFTVEFQQSFANGICVLTSGATNLTVIYD
jgi:hypothetical protein